MIGFETAVGVPFAGCAVAVLDLDEADPAFGHATGGEELAAEGFGVFFVETVEIAGGFGFGVEVEDFRDGVLHAEGEFVALEPSGEETVFRVVPGGELVELMDEIEVGFLDLGGGGDFRGGEGERVGWVDAEIDGVVGRAEVVTVADVEEARADIYETGEIVAGAGEPVIDPCADGGFARVEHVAAGVELDLGAVIVVGGPHGADEGDVVGAGSDVREPVADFDAALAVAAEADLERVDGGALLTVGVVDDDDADILEFLGGLDVLVRGFGDGFAGVLGEGGFGIEAFHVAETAAHEEPDDAFCFGGVVVEPVGG